jgi:hypothetical protein
MRQETFLSLTLCLLLIFTGSIVEVRGQSDSLILEAEQNWDTCGFGGTCIYGGHNFAVADVDGDGFEELITGGGSYNYMSNGSRTPGWAPFKIWTWDGQSVVLEKNESWTGNLYCIRAGDADGDGKIEILTSGRLVNSTGSYSSLRIWTWDGESLLLRAHFEGSAVGSVIALGVNSDGKPEIVTVGLAFRDGQLATQLSIWQFNGNSLIFSGSIIDDSLARVSSVCTCDLDSDGVTEIVTAGYAGSLKNSSGRLSVWQWDSQILSLLSTEEWRLADGYALNSAGNTQGNTLVSTLKAADVDNDGVLEIVTSGFTYDGSRVEGQLRIWNWSCGILNLEKSYEWQNLDITEHTSMAISDVDGDGVKEIITSGYTVGYGSFSANATDKSRAELRVWSWDGTTLTQEHFKDWIVNESVAAWNVGAGDVDNDGVVEIMTVGCTQIGNLLDCDPDLRIWSFSSESQATFPDLDVTAFSIATVIIVVLVVMFLFIRRKLGANMNQKRV